MWFKAGVNLNSSWDGLDHSFLIQSVKKVSSGGQSHRGLLKGGHKYDPISLWDHLRCLQYQLRWGKTRGSWSADIQIEENHVKTKSGKFILTSEDRTRGQDLGYTTSTSRSKSTCDDSSSGGEWQSNSKFGQQRRLLQEFQERCSFSSNEALLL